MLSIATEPQISFDEAASRILTVSPDQSRLEALASEPLARPEESLVRPPHRVLVEALLEQSPADLAWLAWQDGSDGVIVARDGSSPLQPSAIDEFPEPPPSPLTITRSSRAGAWSLWCRSRGILSCTVVPIRRGSAIVGTIGLASCSAGVLDDFDSQRVQLGAALAIQARSHQLRLRSLRRMFDEVSRTLENALALDRALRLPPTYREIARSVAESLDATYCQIAIRDARQTITIRAAGGRRPPRKVGTAWTLERLRRCAQALDERRAVVLSFSQHDAASEPERLALFSPTTKRGVLLPFVAGPRTEGVLIVGEERESRCQPLSPERVAILELVASRVAHIIRISRRLEYERMSDRRRQRQLTVERQRLARDVHDEIGQALSALLVQIRCAMAEGNAGPEALKVLEHAASDALNGARTLAFGFRRLERGVGPLEEARAFAETLLRGAQCRLSWTEERLEGRVAGRTLREIANVIKEAVSNIVRHAAADCARIRVEYPDGRIRVTVQDNGIGFSLQDAQPSRDGRGLGLVGCAERLARVGGVFDINSRPNQGTLVILEAPRGIATASEIQKTVGFSGRPAVASL
jgi:signal transduction histidine kinase